jgi:hypothetical protein
MFKVAKVTEAVESVTVKQHDGWSASLIVERNRGSVVRAKTIHPSLLPESKQLAARVRHEPQTPRGSKIAKEFCTDSKRNPFASPRAITAQVGAHF